MCIYVGEKRGRDRGAKKATSFSVTEIKLSDTQSYVCFSCVVDIVSVLRERSNDLII